MKTKAQGLRNSMAWIEATYGKDALADVLRACSPEVRATCASAIAIEWLPVAQVVEFVGTADRLLSTGTGKLAEAAGEAGARASLKNPLLRAVFYLANPEFLMRRTASIWKQFNDQGEMHLRDFDARGASFELTGCDEWHPVFCALLTGWFREIARTMDIQSPNVRHPDCRGRQLQGEARGPGRCLWELRWAPIDRG